MHIGRIAGATRVLGKSQGYYGLPVRDENRELPPMQLLANLIIEARSQKYEPDAAYMIRRLIDAIETLPVKDEETSFTLKGEPQTVNSMVTAWTPTPEEIKAMEAGANIHIELLGIHHPPIKVYVGPLPS